MAAIVIGGCHTLSLTDGKLMGDPLEKQAFEASEFKQASDGSRVSNAPGIRIKQEKKYLFNSTLKRMSVLAQVTENHNTRLMILSKGAPEVLSKFMA